MLNDLKSVSKDTIIYGIGNVLTKIVGIILIPIYTDPKYLSIADFGVLSILDISAQVMIALFGLSLYQGYLRWYWDMKEEKDRKGLFFSVFLFVSVMSIVMGIGIGAYSGFFSRLLFETPIYSYVILLVTINAVMGSIQTLPGSSMRIQGLSKLYTITSVVKFTVTLLATVYFVVFLERGIDGIFEAQLVGNVAYFIFAASHMYKNMYFSFQFKLIRELILYSYPLIFASISGILLSTIDRFSLNYLASLPDVAIYSLGFKIGGSIKVFIVSSVQLALTPMLLKRINDPNNKRLYSKVLTYFSFGLMWIIIAISVFSREIILLIAKAPEYIEATLIVPIIAMISFFGMARDSVIMGLHVHKKTKIIGSMIVFAALANLGLNTILIPYWGIYGAAFSSLFAQILLFLITLYFAQRAYPIRYELWKFVSIILIGMLLFGVSMWITMPNLWVVFLLKSLLVLSFPMWFFLFPFFEKIEKQSIKSGFIKVLKLGR